MFEQRSGGGQGCVGASCVIRKWRDKSMSGVRERVEVGGCEEG